jgi:hypothetical protein
LVWDSKKVWMLFDPDVSGSLVLMDKAHW